VPAPAGLGIFVVFPLFQAVFLATRGSDIVGNPTRPVGWANFAALLTPDFGRILLQTAVFTAIVVVVGLVVPLALAVPLAQRLPGVKAIRTLFSLPFAYSASGSSGPGAAAHGVMDQQTPELPRPRTRDRSWPGWSRTTISHAPTRASHT